MTTVSTVSELVADLCKRYPRQADQIEAWEPQYRQLLDRYEGPKLAEAHMVMMTGWHVLWFPKPHEVASYLPRNKTAIAGDDGHAEELRQAKERVDAANSWWAERKTALEFFCEYRFRCKFGIPTPENLIDIQAQVEADRHAAVDQESATSGPMSPVGRPKSNRTTMAAPARPLYDLPPHGTQADGNADPDLSDDVGKLEPPIDDVPPPESEEDYGEKRP